MPKVVPPFGSVAISGTGMNGAVAGLNQFHSPLPGVAACPPLASGAGASAEALSAGPDQQGLAISSVARPTQNRLKSKAPLPRHSARRLGSRGIVQPLLWSRAPTDCDGGPTDWPQPHRNSSAKHFKSRSMSAEVRSPIVE